MIKLSDTQSILLSTASQRESGSLLPLPASIKPGGGASKALATLLRLGFAEERETSDAGALHRTDGDLRFGLFITEPGMVEIGVEPVTHAKVVAAVGVPEVAPPNDTAARPASKTATVLALLGRAQGATTADLIAATGWLPHTMRAALTGLRKKGHDIARGKTDGVTCYRIVDAG